MPAAPVARFRLLPGHVQLYRVGEDEADLPRRGLRLLQARRRPAAHDPLADLPERRRERDLRWQAARPRTRQLRGRVDQPLVRRVAEPIEEFNGVWAAQ